ALVPDDYANVRDRPRKVRAAFDESLAWDSPSRMAGRITTREVEIDDYVIPAGTRCGLMFAAANRDPRFWDAPDEYRLERDTKHSLGWGYGVHRCVGRTLATMEGQAFLGAFIDQVESIERAGPYEPWTSTAADGLFRRPLWLQFARWALPRAGREASRRCSLGLWAIPWFASLWLL